MVSDIETRRWLLLTSRGGHASHSSVEARVAAVENRSLQNAQWSGDTVCYGA